MTQPVRWPKATLLKGGRLVLETLRVDHAEEMASVLDDPALHRFIVAHRIGLTPTGDTDEGEVRWVG